MREFFLDLMQETNQICPAFLHVPPEASYPYITIEPLHSLQGLPWGPTLLTFTVKIWSQYRGLKEILKLTKAMEKLLETYQKGRLKITKSILALSTDKKTRTHTFHIKARIPHE